MITKALRNGELDNSAKLITAQDKLSKQVRTAAADLGLTITSRLKLIIPESVENYVEL